VIDVLFAFFKYGGQNSITPLVIGCLDKNYPGSKGLSFALLFIVL
jgi:hypothetical protein